LANYNKFIGVGNLTRDPEMRFTQNGSGLCKFGLAINRKRKGSDDKTLFLDCTAFDSDNYKRAELITRYCEKGSPLLVEGYLELNQWEDKEGSKHSKIELVVDNFQLLRKSDKPA